MTKQEISAGNIPVEQLANLLIEVKPETNLKETRLIFICHTCNNLGLGSAFESNSDKAIEIINRSKHAGHDIKIQTETEFYKNWDITPSSDAASQILEKRKSLIEAGGITILQNS